jgi:crotonobetainyl-CoA:carnitine CoA-transferase CaiB-like acyl-CoA transferase
MTLDSALEGLRILDISQGIAGPYCTSILQQQGACVVKLEPPAGDWARKTGFAVNGFTSPVIAYNAGKRSVCIDLRLPQGVAAARRLAAQADVVVQNFRPGVAARLGLGEAELRAADPRLVYVSISGFGPDGPLVDVPATDSVMQSMTGMMLANRDAQGRPRRIGMHLADIATAMYAAQMTTTALLLRERRGSGSHVEISLLEACAALQAGNIIEATINPALGVASGAPGGVFETADGFVSVACTNDRMFLALCDALDKPGWKADARLSTMGARLRHAAELNGQTAERLKQQPSAYWKDLLQRRDVLHSEVSDYAQFEANPQSQHQGIFARMVQPGIGTLPFARYPGTRRGGAMAPAPANGADNDAVLADAGFTPEDIAQLRSVRALVDPS